ncbi:MAG: aminoglycoside phosphotransferase family protein [Clostridiales bacterium]|jgi:hypothetical protein|nr:aminoglycoside phosphotransferase family protein [Clostridiales bacterium]
MTQQEELNLVKKLTGIKEDKIKVHEDGLRSRGYVIDNGRIVFKFPRDDTTKFGNEIKILNLLNSLGLPINLQQPKYISEKDDYFGYQGVVGESLDTKKLTITQKRDVGGQLGGFLKVIHNLRQECEFSLPLQEEIEEWKKRYLFAKNFIEKNFSQAECKFIDKLIMEEMPSELRELGDNQVFSHADLGRSNILVQQTD